MTAEPLDLEDLPAIGAAAACMGVFDGVHRGHAALLAATRDAATRHACSSLALVFDPPPVEILRPGSAVARLAPLEENLRRLAELGIDHALPVRFDDHVRQLRADEFLARLAPAVQLRALAMTPQSAFGHGRSGTLQTMPAVAAARGFELVAVDALNVDAEVVSSTRIRDALALGDIERANEWLGHPHVLIGTVVAGDHRGRELGFPTANLRFDYRAAIPALGIYVGRAGIPERGVPQGHPALVSIGVRPTFHQHAPALVEVHLLDWSGDLYGATLRLELLGRLRDERRFESADALVAQMRRDAAQARAALGI